MTSYQVLARKYRPKTFKEVIGQEAAVTTLKNAIKSGHLANAYLFCGSRGTGKTTLARVLAKALNCSQPSDDNEPCNSCASCKEIASGSSLDVLEIDGASHRGIDDIRHNINETVSYASASGKYKIYIIDEVHMLTKEAFNALLKTLEEPPPGVKFLFATTEPHKVLPTILSRCQRFNLNRIPLEKIVDKLAAICQDLAVEAEEAALRLIATRADGGLRDAESLLDQMIAFQEGTIRIETVETILGLVSRAIFFELDAAGKEGNLAFAFEITQRVFTEGKDLTHFVESLIEHFRNILLVKISGSQTRLLVASENERKAYEQSAACYSREQCITILDFLVEAQGRIRFLPSARIALEALLLRIIRSHQRIPIEVLVKRLSELEENLAKIQPLSEKACDPVVVTPAPASAPIPAPLSLTQPLPPIATPSPSPSIPAAIPTSIQIDPTPSREDLGLPPAAVKAQKKAYEMDTLLQFTAVELEGRIQKRNFINFS